MEFIFHDGKKVLCEVEYNHVVEEATDHGEIGIRGFGFNLFNK